MESQGKHLGIFLPRIGFDDPLAKGASCSLQNQLGRAPAGPVTNIRIGASLEAIGSVGATVQFFGGAPHRFRLETGTFNENVGGLIVDFRVEPTHDTRQCDASCLIGNEEHFLIQGMFSGIERGECFAWLSGANKKGRHGSFFALNQMVIEGMKGLANFHHDEIGDIDHIVDASDPACFEGSLEPAGAWSDLNPADESSLIPRAFLRIFNADVYLRLGFGCGFLKIDFRPAERVARQGGNFTCDSDEAIVIGSVGCDLQIQ